MDALGSGEDFPLPANDAQARELAPLLDEPEGELVDESTALLRRAQELLEDAGVLPCSSRDDGEFWRLVSPLADESSTR
jgi:hypothetical protein